MGIAHRQLEAMPATNGNSSVCIELGANAPASDTGRKDGALALLLRLQIAFPRIDRHRDARVRRFSP
jgi:hypothetical protein